MVELPVIFQIRKSCIIAYTDYSPISRISSSKEIVRSGKYSSSAQKKFKRYLDLWCYSVADLSLKFSFVTLTISSEMDKNINYSMLLKRLIETLEYRYGKFNYVWRIEFQLNGNLHFHLILDIEVDWKIVRSQWNKLQKIHVDRYAMKMRSKYRHGYYFDSSMLDKNSNVVSEEVQYSRFSKGNRANWRNPNSTDVKIVDDSSSISSYVAKYVSKSDADDSSVVSSHSISRFYGCSDTIRLLKYCSIHERDLDISLFIMLGNLDKKIIYDDKHRYLCEIISRIDNDYLNSRELEQLELNRSILLGRRSNCNSKLLAKELIRYNNLFGN